MEQLRLALIGAGDVARYHMQAWSRIPNATVRAMVDPDHERALQLAAAFDLDSSLVFRELDELLSHNIPLDFVDIAAPPQAHLRLTEKAAEHGLHVLCQKPMALNLAEAKRMIQACKDAGVTLMINENWRWRSWFRRIKTLLDQGAVGEIVYAYILSHDSSWLPDRQKDRGHWFLGMDRALLMEWGIHHIDLLRFLFGDPQTVYARTARLNPTLSGEDRAVVTLAFDGLTSVIDLSWSSYDPRGYARFKRNVEDARIEGDQGTIALIPDPERGDLLRLTSKQDEWEQPAYQGSAEEGYLDSFQSAQDHFVQCLTDGRRPETDGDDNFQTLACTLAAYESARRNQVVHIDAYKDRVMEEDG